MDFESDLKGILNTKFDSVEAPPNLKYKILNRLYGDKKEEKLSFKKRVLITCLGAFLAVPPLGYGYALLADKIYGSYDTVATYDTNKSEYLRFNNKLIQASKILDPNEFVPFLGLLKDLATFWIKNDCIKKGGQVDTSHLSLEKQQEHQKLMNKIQPYFDQLNAASDSHKQNLGPPKWNILDNPQSQTNYWTN